MNYTAADVKKLRDETGATFADCKTALNDSNSWDGAVKFLEARSQRKADKMASADRETKQGGVFAYVHHNNSLGVLIELNCSTDFVARSESFRQLANDLSMQIAGTNPKYVALEDVPEDIISAARESILQDPSMARVPEAKRDEVLKGKLNRVLSEQERVLMAQPFVKDESITVNDLVRKVIAETGENIVLRRFSRFELGK